MSPAGCGAQVLVGVDIGNATTEAVLVTADSSSATKVVAAGRTPTRRTKGSPESLRAAAALIRRLERQHGCTVSGAAIAPLRPVDTRTVSLGERSTGTGRIEVVAAGASTAAGSGLGAGRPYVLTPDEAALQTAMEAGPVVVLVPAGTGFRETVRLLRDPTATGRVVAICLQDDEAVLVANRLGTSVPVVDEVDVSTTATAVRVAVEVAQPGRPLRLLTDPWVVASELQLDAAENGDAAAVARQLTGVGNAVLAALPTRRTDATSATTEGWARLNDGTLLDLTDALDHIASRPVGWIAAFATAGDARGHEVADLWGADLAAVVDAVSGRRSALGQRPVGLASLRTAPVTGSAAHELAALLDVAVTTVSSEAAASRLGALTTPGSTPDAMVVDLGAGTVDVAAPGRQVVAAGGGHLLTAAVAAITGTTSAAAEYVKRGTSVRVEAPQVLLAEDGTRTFLDRPVPSECVGALAVAGPAGLLPFSGLLAPSEWRGLRLGLKRDVLGRNVTRAVSSLGWEGHPIVLVGGPAEDDEVLTSVTSALPSAAVVARGNVAGRLGCRYAVAYGLAVSALPSRSA